MPIAQTILHSQLAAIPVPRLPRVAASLGAHALPTGLAAALSFTMQPQQQTHWCWAAVSSSTSVFYLSSSTWSQCRVVCTALNDTTCCSNPTSPQCNQDGYLDQALTVTGNLSSWAAGQLGFAGVQAEINSQRALALRIGWNGGGGHFIAVAGYKDTGIQQTVDVKDPWYGDSTIPYNTLLSSYQGSGTCTHYYYTKP
jgi:hypothetical protein